MATLTIEGCRPAQPPVIFRRRRPTLEPTGGGAQDRGPVGGGMAAALDLDKNQPAVTALGCSMTPDEDNVIPLPPDRRGPPAPVQPPPSYEPEQSLLGAILVRPEVFPAVIDAGVKSESFSGAAHGRIFQAMLDLYGRGEPVDLVTVTALLKERGKLEGAGRPQEP